MIDKKHLQTFADFGQGLADASGNILREAAHAPFQVEMKGDGSPVTEVDKAIEDHLREMIVEKFPDHGIIGEERPALNPDAEFKWVIDPIDGTLPFLAGFPVFGTLIALVHGETPVVGIIEMSMTNERWVGIEGQPSKRNGEPVRTRLCGDLSGAVMSTSNPDFYSDETRPAFHALKKASRWCVYGGSCMAYARLATGRIDIGIDVDFDLFDYMALVPVIRGAGGMITDWNGADLTMKSGDRFVAAGDQRVHKQALEILALR